MKNLYKVLIVVLCILFFVYLVSDFVLSDVQNITEYESDEKVSTGKYKFFIDYLSKVNELQEQEQDSAEINSVVQNPVNNQTPGNSNNPQVPVPDANKKVILLGDSRFVGMANAVTRDENTAFIAEVGKGYSWLESTAISKINALISNDYKGCTIVTNLGVNDINNCDKYISLYKSLIASDWKGCKFYAVSVNPVDKSKYSGYVTNEMIQDFNNKMKANFNYIDTYSLVESNMSTADGLHYTKDVYRLVYSEIINKVGK